MTRSTVIFILLFVSGTLCLKATAQEAEVGVTVPVTIALDLVTSDRTRSDNPDFGSLSAGFRALAFPQAKLGRRLYLYSAVEAHSAPFFYQERYSADREIETRVLQAYLGYTRSFENVSIGFKAGKLSSAFGAFPLRYDDAANPLLDQPLAHYYLKIRSDHLAYGVDDFPQDLEPDADSYASGEEIEESYGLTPVTLYGLPGAEIDVSWRRLDARFQVTNSSPTNPRKIVASGQHPQWTAGTGYTVRQGFRIGVSAFRGPWLDNAVRSHLPGGTSVVDFPATGLGADVQWAQGSWSVNGEWERIALRYPRFKTLAANFGYIELKRILSARWFTAMRTNVQFNSVPEYSGARGDRPFLPNRQAYEFAIGFRPNRFQVLKAGYEWTRIVGDPQTHDYVLGLQLVTSFDGLSKALR